MNTAAIDRLNACVAALLAQHNPQVTIAPGTIPREVFCGHEFRLTLPTGGAQYAMLTTETAACNALPSKKCVWVKPDVVAQIDLVEWTPDGHLKNSKFVGLRDDKEPRSVTWE